MKRIIYILAAIFSAVAALIFIIEFISGMGEYSVYYGGFFFYLYRCPEIAVLVVFSIFSVVQLKKHTPKIMLVLCGYVFLEAALTLNGQYLLGLLLMSTALIPAIYEFSRYGMMVRQQPKKSEKRRWLLAAGAALALGLTAYRVFLSIMQAVRIEYDGSITYPLGGALIYYPSGIIGIAVLLSAAAFCFLTNRRTGVLYRMFFTGCILFDALNTILLYYNVIFLSDHIPDTSVRIFVLFEALYALFILFILLHALLTRRSGLVTPEAPDITELA